MKQRIKEAAEMYALKAIEFSQLCDVCFFAYEVKEAVEYAEDFGQKYDLEMSLLERAHHKRQKAFEALEELERKREDEWEYQAYLEEEYDGPEGWMYDAPPQYSDKELQEAFDKWYNNRLFTIKRIAIDARKKKIPFKKIYEFFKVYELSNAEITNFWMYYYSPNLDTL